MNKVDVLLGLQWGDEGKGKIVDVLTPKYDIIARFQGGPNAGHTIIFDNKKFVLHTIPSGIFYAEKINIIGNGVIIDPYIMMKEIEMLRDGGVTVDRNLLISNKTHLILPTHRLMDKALEELKGKDKIGSTLKGIGPTYTDKVARHGLRVGDAFLSDFVDKYNKLKNQHIRTFKELGFDYIGAEIEGKKFAEYEQLWFTALEEIKQITNINSEYYIHKALIEGKKILAEGAQGTMLDVDFGSYPFVTSSNTITAGVCTGLGISPREVGKVFGIVKAYCTRVGSGPFPTELFDNDGEELRRVGCEFGSTTGRPRRTGWLDLPALNYAIMIDGVTDIILMKVDVMDGFETIKVCTKYKYNGVETEELPFGNIEVEPVYESIEGWNCSLENVKTAEQLPAQLKSYIKYIEDKTQTPVSIISTGPDRAQTLVV